MPDIDVYMDPVRHGATVAKAPTAVAVVQAREGSRQETDSRLGHRNETGVSDSTRVTNRASRTRPILQFALTLAGVGIGCLTAFAGVAGFAGLLYSCAFAIPMAFVAPCGQIGGAIGQCLGKSPGARLCGKTIGAVVGIAAVAITFGAIVSGPIGVPALIVLLVAGWAAGSWFVVGLGMDIREILKERRPEKSGYLSAVRS